MNDVVQEWVSKAEGDYRTANREFAVTDEPNYDAVCYHAAVHRKADESKPDRARDSLSPHA
ncbi:hypothetical protein [Allomeiothermus silvanus]|uniref:hypothetical protein n=1 Tax=Allomeiothermus silvanus TaxID=52022 RepID=UPI001FD961B2|nr:hypothetical protein [Allomeiothermus silvanus]